MYPPRLTEAPEITADVAESVTVTPTVYVTSTGGFATRDLASEAAPVTETVSVYVAYPDLEIERA